MRPLRRERKEGEHCAPPPAACVYSPDANRAVCPGINLLRNQPASGGALGAAYPARSVHSHQALHPSGVCDHSTEGALTAVAHWSRVVCGTGTRSAR